MIVYNRKFEADAQNIFNTTATNLMTDPWKDTLWRVEWLDEALSVEYTFAVLALPFSRWFHCGHLSHKSAGYGVKRERGKSAYRYKVFIEVFQCPALK